MESIGGSLSGLSLLLSMRSASGGLRSATVGDGRRARELVGGLEVEVAPVAAQPSGDERGRRAAELRGLRSVAVERQAAQEAGGEGVAAAGGVDHVDLERR